MINPDIDTIIDCGILMLPALGLLLAFILAEVKDRRNFAEWEEERQRQDPD